LVEDDFDHFDIFREAVCQGGQIGNERNDFAGLGVELEDGARADTVYE
jgi:hypothetical protein